MLDVRRLSRSGLQVEPFSLADGECGAVRGPSGSGKSLFLRAIADLDPNEGEMLLDGESREAMPAPCWRRRISYVAAEPGWWADTVGGHFADWPAAEPLVEQLLLPASCRDWSILRLSTGEKQRLGLIRTLVQAPRVLLLDEPTGALDPDATAAVERLLAGRLQSGAGALWVTHDEAQTRRVATRCFTVDAGHVREEPL